MSTSQKQISTRDHEQTLQFSFNDVNKTLGTDGFLVGVVGNKITQAITTTNVDGDTAVLTFSQNGTTLYVYTIIYTDATQEILLSAERTA